MGILPRAKSKLIYEFLAEVTKGQITAQEGTAGHEALDRMLCALCSILDGRDPNEAFGITRSPGRPMDTRNLILAVCIHRWRLDGHQWSGIEVLANEWLEKRGDALISLPRIKQIYKEHNGAKMYESIKNHDWGE